MGAAAGKQFQSEKAKHAQAVLSAVELFEESNHQEQESYGGVSTEFFKKKVMLAASDAKRKGKDIEKSLAQLTDADMDMLAHYVENRKAEERRQAAGNGNTMQVEEIADGDNVDETTSVLSYGDAEEEAAENDDLESSDEMLENIEEVVDSRPRVNSGFKVFPMGDEAATKAGGDLSNSHSKSKLKLDEATVRPGIADHIAKFWDYDELGSLASLATSGAGGADSPHGGAHSPNSTVIGKKFQPSPKQSFPYKDRGQRIDERNEALMVLQRQKVISLTQNAQLEREVEALQRQLEKMDQLDQTFESARLGSTNKSNASLNNTGNSSSTIGGGGGGAGAGGTGGASGFGSGNALSKYSYIYPIDEEAGEHHSQRQQGEFRKSDAKAAGQNPPWRQRRDKANKGGSSPSSSDNDSVNSYNNSNPTFNNKNAAPAAGNAKLRGAGAGVGPSNGGTNVAADMRAGAKNAPILRVRSNDPGDLSDELGPVPSQPTLSKVGKSQSTVGPGAGPSTNTGAAAASAHSGKGRRVRVGASGLSGGNYEGDSDDSAQLVVQNSRHAPAAAGSGSGYNPSHPSQKHAHRAQGPSGGEHSAEAALQAKHGESDSENHESNIGRANKPQVLKNRRVVSVNVKSTAHIGSAADEGESKSKAVDSESSAVDQSPSMPSKSGQVQARRNPHLTSDDAKQTSSPARNGRDREDHASPATAAASSDPKYQALMENVSMHLEAARKDVDSVVGAAGGAGSNKMNTNRNRHGGALKKLNKRRHSMDGLEDSTSNQNISNTDTSQDEVDASSPSSKYKRFGRQAAGAGAGGGAAGLGVEGAGLHRSPQGTHAVGGESYVTTDDDSVGPGGVRSKLRRPRTKLVVQTSPNGHAGAITTTKTSSTEGAAASSSAAVDGSAGEGYQPSVPASKAHAGVISGGAEASIGDAESGGAGVGASALAGVGASAGAAGPTVSRVKRRARSVSKDKSGKESVAPGMAGVGGFIPGANPWDTQLDQWWAEVGLLLRKPILQEEDMQYTVAAAEAGLIYTDEMNAIAKGLNVLRGALSRWILPYDNNTRIESQCSTPHSVVENMPEEFRGKLTERQVHYLVAGANGVRKLIRVKIADDNDLEQARKALKSTDMFFKALYHRAGEANITPYQLLQMADSSR